MHTHTHARTQKDIQNDLMLIWIISVINICALKMLSKDFGWKKERKTSSQIHLVRSDKMLTPHCNKHRKRSHTQNEKKRNNHFNVYKFDLFIDTVRSFFLSFFLSPALSRTRTHSCFSLLLLPFLFGFQSHIELKNVHIHSLTQRVNLFAQSDPRMMCVWDD